MGGFGRVARGGHRHVGLRAVLRQEFVDVLHPADVAVGLVVLVLLAVVVVVVVVDGGDGGCGGWGPGGGEKGGG